jgi:hypothetical protein
VVTADTPAGTDRAFAAGSAPTAVVRLPTAPQPPEPPPPFMVAEPPPPFQPAPEPPPPFQPAPEPPPLFQPAPEPPPPFRFEHPQPFDQGPTVLNTPSAPDPADRIGGPGGSAPRKSSAGMWIALSAIVILLFAGIGAAAYWWFGDCGWCRVQGTTPPPPPPGGDQPPTVPQKPERVLADEYLQTKPNPEAMVEQCRTFRQDGKLVAAFLVCRAAAEGGDPVGAAEYASFFDPVNRLQYSPVPADAQQAVQWYEKAAKVELPLAMRRLGELYAKGADNFPADKAKAREWLTKAADKGDAEARKALSEL